MIFQDNKKVSNTSVILLLCRKRSFRPPKLSKMTQLRRTGKRLTSKLKLRRKPRRLRRRPRRNRRKRRRLPELLSNKRRSELLPRRH